MDNLDILEAEAIHIIRETAAEIEKPVLLYSMGKDSVALAHITQKAFAPAKIPFPFMHIDTGYKFKEMYEFREKISKSLPTKLIVYSNKKAIDEKANPWDLGTQKCCQLLKTQALLMGLNEGGFQAALGASRRDEEKARAKERIFSFRDKNGKWNPKDQRPEVYSLYNTKIEPGESIRVFPLSNWTELNVWQYIKRENIDIVPLYFAKKRKVIDNNGTLIPYDENLASHKNKKTKEVLCRFRSLGCLPCTGAIESTAQDVDAIIDELGQTRISERSSRVIDFDSDSSMENKKKQGYF